MTEHPLIQSTHADDPGPGPAIHEALGGPLGIAESAAPAVVFVIAYSIAGQEPTTAAIIAAAVGGLFALARIARKETIQFALAGMAGLAISAFVVSRTGNAEDFFLPGLLLNGVYAAGYLISILVRWPLIGLILETAMQKGTAWRKDPTKLKLYSRVSWIWVAMFSLRLVVQVPLYFADAVAALGVARVAMGVPLFALAIYLSWLLIREPPVSAAPARP
ncbi:DUF3159 domain-containing protein [Svornostia abyssi]|uniref:DUF3159 domain-containing protein n=1 Tax=Svornostia abyssi TaxID=2898438 RepID=A0ABY5PK43_9ACTN|nr:DUF3159 domain-containing protein [Parviterribacteraceae bacterium J379]